jgi:hypothetical protein
MRLFKKNCGALMFVHNENSIIATLSQQNLVRRSTVTTETSSSLCELICKQRKMDVMTNRCFYGCKEVLRYNM